MYCPGERVQCCVQSTDPKVELPQIPFRLGPVGENLDQDPIAFGSDDTGPDELDLDGES